MTVVLFKTSTESEIASLGITIDTGIAYKTPEPSW